MPFLLAAVLVLDQRIELQLPLLLALTVAAVCWQAGTRWEPGKAGMALGVAAAYLLLNSAVTFIDPNGVSDAWWAAPVRIWLYYVLLIAVATLLSAPRLQGDAIFRTLEWLFVLKLLIIAFEGYIILQTGEARERPLFNIVIASDAMLGMRFTSSYDFLFALLVFSPRRLVLRLLILAAVVAITETRALLLLSAFFLLWRLLQHRSPLVLAASVAIPVLAAIAAITVAIEDREDTQPRLTQLSGSSLDDKLEQIDAVSDLIASPYLLTGRGVGATIPNIVRDELRPYSYETQTPVLLWQGGLLFYLVHCGIIWYYTRGHRLIGLLIILGLGFLNPTLFSFASAFFLTSFGATVRQAHEPRQRPHRGAALHAQR